MEIVISVSEAELEEFPEEKAPVIRTTGAVWKDIAYTRYCKKLIIHQHVTHPGVVGKDKKGQSSLPTEVYS